MDMHEKSKAATVNGNNARFFDTPDAMLSQLEAMVGDTAENASHISVNSEKSCASKSRKKRRKSGDESQCSEKSRKSGSSSHKGSSARSAGQGEQAHQKKSIEGGCVKLPFGQDGMDFLTFQQKAASGELSLEKAFEDMLKIGGREEWQAYFYDKMREDPAAYGNELTNMRPDKCQDKKMQKYKKIYEEDGQIGLNLELEDEFDQIPREIRQNIFKLQAPAQAKVLSASGDKDNALREFKVQYVKDKSAHIRSLVNDDEFKIMQMLATGQGLRIPPQAILSPKKGASGQYGDSTMTSAMSATKKKKNAELERKKQLAECEAELRDALQRNDKNKMDRMVAKIKELKGMGSYSLDKKGGTKSILSSMIIF